MEITNGKKIELFERLAKVEEAVHEIKTNDLVHIHTICTETKQEVKEIKNKGWWIFTVLVGNLIGVIVTLGFLILK